MEKTVEERVKSLENKIHVLEGANLLKEDSEGPYKDNLTKR